MKNIEKNLNSLHQQIQQACQRFQRPENAVQLLAVSKRKPATDIIEAFDAGQRSFGENYLQEALDKINQLDQHDIEWHFIGAIQSNKTRPIAENFDWVHCVERMKIATRLNEQRPDDLPPLNVCIQVNIDNEASKAGISLDEVPELAHQMQTLSRIKLRGLMAIPAPADDEETRRLPFAKLKQCLNQLNQQGIDCDTLSMGMTNDLDAAIAEGSTMVRIGTAIFGERT